MGSTADACAGLIQKQLNSVGVPSVADILSNLDSETLGKHIASHYVNLLLIILRLTGL